jgi:hypothetical protein
MKILKYLQETKYYVSTYKKLNHPDIVGYSNLDFFKKIHIWIFVLLNWRNTLIKECEVIYYQCIHFESQIYKNALRPQSR